MQSVIVYEPNGWYSTFLVNGVHIIDTVDVYTYQCLTCDSFECEHVKAVNNYILQGMGLFCEALDLKKLAQEMNTKLEELANYTTLYFRALESRKLVTEMRTKINVLRDSLLISCPKQVYNPEFIKN
jgi:hypothetical protein